MSAVYHFAAALLLAFALLRPAAAQGFNSPIGGMLKVIRPYCMEPDANTLVEQDRGSDECIKDRSECKSCESVTPPGTPLNGRNGMSCPGAPALSEPGVCHSEALFGVPQYAAKLVGKVYYPASQSDGCKPFASEPWNDGMNEPVILLLDRGNCTFVQKVRNAQNSAANAVIVANNIPGVNPLMADDGTGADVDIPAMIISQEDGNHFKSVVAAHTELILELSWSQQHPDNRVEWSFWSSADHLQSVQFVKNFRVVAEALGDSAELSPNYLIINGEQFGCQRENLPCARQCAYKGRYCAEDPEHDFEAGIDGEDVVMENLRQLCIWRAVNATGDSHLWWEYVVAFDTNCEAEEDFHGKCSLDQQQSAGLSAAHMAAVKKCVDDSESETNCPFIEEQEQKSLDCLRTLEETPDAQNPILEDMLNKRSDDGIFILPTILVNGKKYLGRLTCPHPVSMSTCGLLSAICAGFSEPEKVPACSPTYCWQSMDHCGECRSGEDDPDWDATCCDETPGMRLDACGVCGGGTKKPSECTNHAASTNLPGDEHVTKTHMGVFAAMFILIIIVLVIAMVIYIRRSNEEHRRHVENVVASYMPLDDGGNSAAAPPGSDKVSLTTANAIAENQQAMEMASQ